ncbi:MAG: aminotransferase class V-fold PLP-dependent enzyme [Amylibacter sp.]|nr:aminotransferase class V-fold PLP-dependent enzyme [Amylibacter sp.]
MSLNFGREQLSIPGPSVMPDRVLAAMHRPSPNIYEGDLIKLTHSLFPDLKTVAQTKHSAAVYIANGHGAWEAAISNTCSRGDTILVLVTGRFGAGWAEMASELGVQTRILNFGMDADADPAVVTQTLKEDVDHVIKAVFTVQTDTASSVKNDIKALRKAIDEADHPALFFVDCIASLGCDKFEMDAWGVDVMVTGCQKGLMTPAGMSFVFFNDKGHLIHRRANLKTPYWDWEPRANPEVYYQHFCGTAPTHHLYGLREALNILVHEEGIEAAWARHMTMSRAVWAAVEAWGCLAVNIKEPSKRSQAVTTVLSKNDECGRLRHWCEHKAGLTLGIGLGLAEPGQKSWDNVMRIGHMGHMNPVMLMGALGTIDAGLKAMRIPHGPDALNAASSEIAKHFF